MGIKLDMIGIISADIADSLRFCRMFDLDIPEPPEGEDHVEVTLPNGLRLAWDALSMMKELSPESSAPVRHRLFAPLG